MAKTKTAPVVDSAPAPAPAPAPAAADELDSLGELGGDEVADAEVAAADDAVAPAEIDVPAEFDVPADAPRGGEDEPAAPPADGAVSDLTDRLQVTPDGLAALAGTVGGLTNLRLVRDGGVGGGELSELEQAKARLAEIGDPQAWRDEPEKLRIQLVQGRDEFVRSINGKIAEAETEKRRRSAICQTLLGERLDLLRKIERLKRPGA